MNQNMLDDKKVIIVIGLPGSGKTYLSKNICKSKYILYDDFVKHFYNGDLLRDITNGEKVCMNDPRLCMPNVFHRYINIIMKHTETKNILLIIYDNYPEKCIFNINNRKNKERFISAIYGYSKIYDISVYDTYNIDKINLDVETYGHIT